MQIASRLSVGREPREKTCARILVRGRDQRLGWGEPMARIASGSFAVSGHLVPSSRDLTQWRPRDDGCRPWTVPGTPAQGSHERALEQRAVRPQVVTSP